MVLAGLPSVWVRRKTSLARKRETARYNTAELSQPKQNVATPVHQGTAHEEIVNSVNH